MGEIGWIISCGVECSETARVHVVKLFQAFSLHGQITKRLRIPFFQIKNFYYKTP